MGPETGLLQFGLEIALSVLIYRRAGTFGKATDA